MDLNMSFIIITCIFTGYTKAYCTSYYHEDERIRAISFEYILKIKAYDHVVPESTPGRIHVALFSHHHVDIRFTLYAN